MAKAKKKVVKTRILKITQGHIDNGTPREGDSCPIAMALQELCPNATVNVDVDEINIDDKKIKTPANARRFIKKFDAEDGEPQYDLDSLDFELKEAQKMVDYAREELTKDTKAFRLAKANLDEGKKAWAKWNKRMRPITIKLPKDIC